MTGNDKNMQGGKTSQPNPMALIANEEGDVNAEEEK